MSSHGTDNTRTKARTLSQNRPRKADTSADHSQKRPRVSARRVRPSLSFMRAQVLHGLPIEMVRESTPVDRHTERQARCE
jgi:hypothetical protein